MADVMVLIDCRPLKSSLASHLQKLGRVMRAAPNKEFGLVLDHAGNYLRFLEAAEDVWYNGVVSLDESDREALHEKIDEGMGDTERKCKGCGFILPPDVKLCPSCGMEKQKKPAYTPRETGDLVQHRTLQDEVPDLWPHICAWAYRKRPNDAEAAGKMAYAIFREVTGKSPNQQFNPAPEIDPRVISAMMKRDKAFHTKQNAIKRKKERDAKAKLQEQIDNGKEI